MEPDKTYNVIIEIPVFSENEEAARERAEILMDQGEFTPVYTIKEIVQVTP